jgi:hypothetical protein
MGGPLVRKGERSGKIARISGEAVKAKTGKNWPERFKSLDAAAFAEMSKQMPQKA